MATTSKRKKRRKTLRRMGRKKASALLRRLKQSGTESLSERELGRLVSRTRNPHGDIRGKAHRFLIEGE